MLKINKLNFPSVNFMEIKSIKSNAKCNQIFVYVLYSSMIVIVSPYLTKYGSRLIYSHSIINHVCQSSKRIMTKIIIIIEVSYDYITYYD